MKKNLPVILIIVSVILILVNIITLEKLDKSFWTSITSSVLIIIAMILTVKNRKGK